VEQNDGFLNELPCLPESGTTSSYALTSGSS
jgi:hypothetical protein